MPAQKGSHGFRLKGVRPTTLFLDVFVLPCRVLVLLGVCCCCYDFSTLLHSKYIWKQMFQSRNLDCQLLKPHIMPWPWEMPMINTYNLYPWKEEHPEPKSPRQTTSPLHGGNKDAKTAQRLVPFVARDDYSEAMPQPAQVILITECTWCNEQQYTDDIPAHREHESETLAGELNCKVHSLQLRYSATNPHRICCAGMWSWLKA